ncbi:hypothetical protein [Streptobacillus canis]|uniref:hypothetical protein n=1 Tax=Streptobacillus canis TaxID=2678686 RepID=UPI0012E2654C|nr:hypothetical protein [Streptobacillus canis]
MLKNRLLVLSFFMLSANLLANGSVDEKLDMGLEKINEIEKKVVYDREIVNDKAQSISVGDGEKVSVVYNVDYDAAGSYVIFSNSKPDSIKLVNNGKLESYAEVFTSRHNHDYRNLIHFTNNGIINGTANNANALTLYAPYVYYKGERGSRLYGEIYKPLDIEASKFSVVDNAGEIIKGTLILGKENNLINRKHGSIDKVGIIVEEKIRLKNEGKITENTSLHANESIDFENSGKITGRLSISKNNFTYQPYYGYGKKRILKTKFINNENGLLEFLNSRFSFEIDSPELDFVNKGRIFYSKDAIIKKEDLKDEVMSRYQKSLGKINIKHYLGRFVNENIIDGSIRFEEKIDNNVIDIKPFEIHLEDGILNGGIDIDFDETISGGKYKGNEIIVSINEVRDISEKI